MRYIIADYIQTLKCASLYTLHRSGIFVSYLRVYEYNNATGNRTRRSHFSFRNVCHYSTHTSHIHSYKTSYSQAITYLDTVHGLRCLPSVIGSEQVVQR